MPRLLPPDFGDNNMPVLDIAPDTVDVLALAHEQARDPEVEDVGLLTGTILCLDNPSTVGDPNAHDKTLYVIGSETLQEAACSVIGAYVEHGRHMPEWVASTDEQLAAVVAEHYTIDGFNTCKVIAMDEVPS